MSKQVKLQVTGVAGCVLFASALVFQLFLAIAIPSCILGCLVAATYYLCTGEFILK